jgi:chorismate dehydratase
MIRVTAVSYLNTIPFIYGIKQSILINNIDLHLDYPALCAEKLINEEVDLALVPVVAIADLKEHHIISDYCIGANGAVDTVCLYSEIPIQKVTSIFLDYQSKTSVALLKILLKEYWALDPEIRNGKLGFENEIRGENAGLVIGDRAFELNNKYEYIYDLSAIWKDMTDLPFVFAAWVANKKLPEDFITQFNRSLTNGLRNINKALKEYHNLYCENPKDYLNNKISYRLDAEKLKGMNLFLRKI